MTQDTNAKKSENWYDTAGRLATPEEYAPLHRELTRIYDDCELIIQKRVQHTDLLKGWKRT